MSATIRKFSTRNTAVTFADGQIYIDFYDEAHKLVHTVVGTPVEAFRLSKEIDKCYQYASGRA